MAASKQASKQASKHTHACAQCSHTSVGLAQARPNKSPDGTAFPLQANPIWGMLTIICIISLCNEANRNMHTL